MTMVRFALLTLFAAALLSFVWACEKHQDRAISEKTTAASRKFIFHA